MSNSSIHCHALGGCSPTPLAHYLKALGILRLVAEQKDPAARGWWRNDVFHLATSMDREALTNFFLNEYAPTPLVAPWNGGSGFYPKDNKSGIEPIENSESERFAPFREAIQTARGVVEHLQEKPDKGDAKNNVIAKCRLACRGGMQQWIDAALVISADGEPSFPALLGTGGNDGRLDFTTNYMQRLVSLFDAADPAAKPFDETIPQLDAAIWGDPTPTLESGAIGQFFPGAAGGPNGTSGFDGGVQVNPWDYVLMLEGAIIFRSGLSRKCASQQLPQAAAPFAVRASGAGYGSSDSADAGARGEQWMPLWSRPSTLAEVSGIFREGRNKIGGKLAERATDMARSVARMGVARGISSFERYGYIERNGLANLAVPLGRFEVRRGRNQELLDEVAPWLDRLRRLASAKNSPESFDRVHRACENSLIACTRSDEASGYLALLVSLAKAEDQMVQSPKFAAENFATPLPRLSHRWLEVVAEAEDSAELRLARALAVQHGRLEPKEPSRSVRIHWLPLDGNYFAKGESGLNIGPEQASIGVDLERALIALMNRRMLAVAKGVSGASGDTKRNERSQRVVPLALSQPSLGSRSEDIEAFLEFGVNDAKLLAIARGLMAVDTRRFKPNEREADNNQHRPLGGLATFGLLRLATPVGPIRLPNQADKYVRCNPLVYRRLQTGNLTGAIDIARQQLVAAGLRPRIQAGIGSPQFARRLAASMAFGVAPLTITRLALGLTQPKLTREERQELEAITEPI